MLTPKQIKDAIKKYGGANKAADAVNVPRSTFKRWAAAVRDGEARLPELVERRAEGKPRKGYVKRYILTAAQDNTPLNKPFWDNLVAYANALQAEIIVAGYTYANKSADPNEFAPQLQPYLSNAQVNIGDRLLFCGEVNTSPTAVRPLSGMETYTRAKWGVFPHPRVELRSIATMFSEPSKQIMTTGAVTVPNYLPRKAGVKAEFHHIFGAVLVELDADGDVFCRHLIADKAGSFYDLGTFVSGGVVTEGHTVDSITWGDIHAEEVDPLVADLSWGNHHDSILNVLRPHVLFVHDLQDFTYRNHHNIYDPHWRFKMWSNGKESVAKGVAVVSGVLNSMRGRGADVVIVESNHDLMMARWLREGDYQNDPINAKFYLEASLALYNEVAAGNERFSVFEWAVRRHIGECGDVIFLRESDSYKRNGIEHGLHGHKGANGAKGHVNSFARMGSRANTAHTHSPAIHEGIVVAGTSSKLDMEYNRGGLSSWAHSHIVNYHNGKRALITIQNGKWRA